MKNLAAGDTSVGSTPDGTQSQASTGWFEDAAELDDRSQAWLFDDEALEDDGWIKVNGKTSEGNPWIGWKRG